MPQKTKVENKDPWWVEAEVKRRNTRLTALAEAAGCHHSTVTQARFRIIPRGNRIIADFLGLSVHELWPEWFDEAGNPIRGTGDSDDGSNRPDGHRQKVAAA